MKRLEEIAAVISVITGIILLTKIPEMSDRRIQAGLLVFGIAAFIPACLLLLVRRRAKRRKS